jgi:uncharacterized membrane protein (UPF0127 family)
MKKLSIEIADTPSKRATGLMDRKSLGENNGMLFKFTHDDYLRFWMKSTYIPLDIAFLNDDGVILQISEMSPLSTRMICSSSPCKNALEVNRGWFKKNDIGIGDKIGGLEIADKKYRLNKNAQMTPMPQSEPEMPLDGSLPTPPAGNEQNNQNETQPDPRAMMVLDDRAKVRYAEQKNLAMQIIYQSKESGQVLPPRKLLPAPGEGYPIRVSSGGDYFVAFDSSPTISGSTWEILGNQIKRFLFSNIIALEVLEEFADELKNKKGYSNKFEEKDKYENNNI